MFLYTTRTFPYNGRKGHFTVETKPLLSIGMIIKNEIRCLKRCLESLKPLRQAIPCELVIADTGSTDGSREVAQQYADILFDFPWIDDFAAARNAVLQRCSGQWYLSIDADEFLDADCSALVAFLQDKRFLKYQAALITIRNYFDRDLRHSHYTDQLADRLLNRASGACYRGAIHESFSFDGPTVATYLKGVVLHHDGYSYASKEEREKKHQRNMKILRKELEQDPHNCMRLMQCVESCQTTSPVERNLYCMRGMETLQSNPELVHDRFAAPLARHCVVHWLRDHLPAGESWLQWMGEQFPNSIFYRVDCAYEAGVYYCQYKKDYKAAFTWFQMYFSSINDVKADRIDINEMSTSLLLYNTILTWYTAKLFMAECLIALDRQSEAIPVLKELDMSAPRINEDTRNNYLVVLQKMPDLPEAQQLAADYLRLLDRQGKAFGHRDGLKGLEIYSRIVRSFYDKEHNKWMLFLRAEGDIGISARILNSQDPAEISDLCTQISSWGDAPYPAAVHGMLHGATLPESLYQINSQNLKEIAVLLAGSTQDGEQLLAWIGAQKETAALPKLQFLFFLLIAIVRKEGWAPTVYSQFCQLYIQVSSAYLKSCYTSEILNDPQNWCILPDLYSYTLHLLDGYKKQIAGDQVGYVQSLEAALDTAPVMKQMVKFLLWEIEQKQRQNTPPELLQLAEQVRAILAQYPPDDPAVYVLKQSEAYKRVAYLIEGMDAPVFGGLVQ